MLLLHWKTALTTALCAAAFSQLGLAQVAPTTILQIDVENQVEYDLDVSDLAQWATNPNVVRSQPPRNFDLALFFVQLSPRSWSCRCWRLCAFVCDGISLESR